MNYFDYIGQKQRACAEEYDRGFRTGIGTMLLFVVPPLIVGLTNLSVWMGSLIVGVIWLPTIFWLSSKGSDYENKTRAEYAESQEPKN